MVLISGLWCCGGDGLSLSPTSSPLAASSACQTPCSASWSFSTFWPKPPERFSNPVTLLHLEHLTFVTTPYWYLTNRAFVYEKKGIGKEREEDWSIMNPKFGWILKVGTKLKCKNFLGPNRWFWSFLIIHVTFKKRKKRK